MKISKTQLKKIIKEEISRVLGEATYRDAQELDWEEEERKYKSGGGGHPLDDPIEYKDLDVQKDLVAKLVTDDDTSAFDIFQTDSQLKLQNNEEIIQNVLNILNKTTLEDAAKIEVRNLYSTLRWDPNGVGGGSPLFVELYDALVKQGVDKA